MKSVLAASAVLALAGTSYGFVINFASVQPGATLSPSSGSFVNYYSCYWCGAGSMVTSARSNWNLYGDNIQNTTWLALDSLGGAPGYSTILAGPGADPFVPFAPGSSAQWLGGAADGLQNDGSAVVGGGAGVTWGPGASDNFAMDSAVSPVNGSSLDSVFVGHFVLTDGAATLTGQDLFAVIDGVNTFLPLDGSKGTGGYVIEYEAGLTPDGSSYLDAFIVVPTPGAAGLLGFAGLAAMRRRR